ncbi:uncharacterized protein LOC124254199 [Haliotis rubra]|uniref:uncharacterized protein LOC124254199 n=1 Tax=Haliotis rubra TaxID=36100 RepID=UPI001EE5FBD2|nr:uncharacterized protein LOC124254199 [Haliotis rubra]
MSSAMYRHRQKTIPVLPQTRSEVNLQDSWTQTADGRPFLLFSDGDDDKILAFGTMDSLQALQSSEIIYMDGTFTACPEREFPTAEVKGCFFHYCQVIWRKVQDLGLAVAYREDLEISRWVRREAGLPLLPQNSIQDTWVDAMDDAPDVPRAATFNDYMVTTWVDNDARFRLPLWNLWNLWAENTNAVP